MPGFEPSGSDGGDRRQALGPRRPCVPVVGQAPRALGGAGKRLLHAATRFRARPRNAGRGVRATRLSLGLSRRQFDGIFAAAAAARAVRRDDQRCRSRLGAARRRSRSARGDHFALDARARVLLDRRRQGIGVGSRRDSDAEERLDGRDSVAARDPAAERAGRDARYPRRRAASGIRGRLDGAGCECRPRVASMGAGRQRRNRAGREMARRAAREPGFYERDRDRELAECARWPKAARFDGMRRRRVEIGAFPVWRQRAPLADFLCYQGKGLSARATRGFLLRTERSSLRFPPGFLDALRRHVICMEAAPPRAIPAFAAE